MAKRFDLIAQLPPPPTLDVWRAKKQLDEHLEVPEVEPYDLAVDAMAVLSGALRLGGVQRDLVDARADEDQTQFTDYIADLSHACVRKAVVDAGAELTIDAIHLPWQLSPVMQSVINTQILSEGSNG